MSKKDKLIQRLKQRPKDFTWSDLVLLLTNLGYQEVKKGKTGGSRRRFIHEYYEPILLHEPHPKKILKRYQVIQVLEVLIKREVI